MPNSYTHEGTRFNFTKVIPVFEEWLKTREAEANAHLISSERGDAELAITYWSKQAAALSGIRHCWGMMSPPQRRAMLRTIWQAMEQAR